MQTVLRAEPLTPLRDWLRGDDTVAAWFGTDAGLGVPAIYSMLAAGSLPPRDARLPALLIAQIGGTDDEVALDFPMVEFAIWGETGQRVVQIAADLHQFLLNTRPGTAMAAGLQFMGASKVSSLGSPTTDDKPRWILTESITTKAV